MKEGLNTPIACEDVELVHLSIARLYLPLIPLDPSDLAWRAGVSGKTVEPEQTLSKPAFTLQE